VAGAFSPDVTLAQRGGYYQPRIYNSPPPRYSRDAYIASGTAIGGVAGARFGGYAGAIGGAAGGYYGARSYDYQSRNMRQSYYYPRAYGIQTTTPYMVRTVPRY
jgi:hypothetical protein